MYSMLRLSRVVLVICLVISLAGCGKKEAEELPVEKKFDTVIQSLCVENIGPDIEAPLIVLEEALIKENVPSPYIVFDNVFGGSSQEVTFNILDADSKMVHVRLYSTKDGYDVECLRDTSVEAKEQITRLLQGMLGESVAITIEDTYSEYVKAYAQGKEFRWKDGHLERVP